MWKNQKLILDPQCIGAITSSWHPLCLEIVFSLFLLSLSWIKRSQLMPMKKIGPTALNFGKEFFLLVTFFGTPRT